ncbi:MAG TPA: serine/threonine-protein kinase [Pirellulales bacterium]|jgi:serine/threonine protein kinase|nr:serine/threonine-protein kinase [Pirellulales bacterium]
MTGNLPDGAKSDPSSEADAPATVSRTPKDRGSDAPDTVLSFLSRQVRLFSEAWNASPPPPSLHDYVPAADLALGGNVCRLVVLELIKVDLSRRWPQADLRRPVEHYLQEFPELLADGHLPYDLIFEEFRLRRELGEAVNAAEYERRFPDHAVPLRRLLSAADNAPSTAMALACEVDDVAVGSRLDDFDLLLSVGNGAFARVFLARQRSMQRLVALKVSADRGNEPQTMAQLDHPHIVRVFDQRTIKERNLRLLYMQYVSGGTLQTVVQQVRAFPPAARSGRLLFAAVDQCLAERGESAASDSPLRLRLSERSWPEVVCWLGSRLAWALDYAHRRGVLHRDIKPANVLISSDGSPKLADFNISYCSKVEGTTPAAYFGGSLPYMSPEQLEAFDPLHEREPGDVDARGDIYSLAVVLWELLTGERPFHDSPASGGWVETLDGMIARRQAPPARSLPDDLPPGLIEALHKCLAPNRDDRFASAGQLARQLDLCLQGRAQRLLVARAGWRPLAQRFSVLALLTAGLVPNVAASALSISYNQTSVISHLGPDAQRVFNRQLAVINPIAYSVAVGWLLWLAWPVVVGVYRRRMKQAESPGDRAVQRRRCLRIGEYVAWVTAGAWMVSGIVFPVWLRLDPRTSGVMTTSTYESFFTALVVCGLMAATLSFFCVTFVAVRALYPQLVDAEATDSATSHDLTGLARRSGYYFLAAVSVPFIALLAVVLLLAKDDRGAVFGLAVIGLCAFFVSYRLSREIENDVASLILVVNPAASMSDSSSLVSDSSWGST